GGAVDAEVLRRQAALAAQVDLDGAAADGAADDLLELRLEQVVGLGGPHRHLEVAVVQGAELEGDADVVALVVGLAVAGHAQQHAPTSFSGLPGRSGGRLSP